MSFRGGGGRGFSRGGSGGGFRGGRGGGRGGYNNAPQGPPDSVIAMGSFMHACEGELVCTRVEQQSKIPYFNAPIFLENKTQIGKVDEIFGPLNEVYFTVKLQEGVIATSFKKDDKVYIAGDKLLPLERFLPRPAVAKPAKPLGRQGLVEKRGGGRGGRGGFRGGSRGGAGGFRGGAGAGRGGFSRGGGAGGRGGFGGRGGATGGRGGGFSRGAGRGGSFTRGGAR